MHRRLRSRPTFTDDASYLLGDGMDLQLRLYSAKSNAVVNASTYAQNVGLSAGLSPTNMNALLNDITEICGLADLSHNQRQLGLRRKDG